MVIEIMTSDFKRRLRSSTSQFSLTDKWEVVNFAHLYFPIMTLTITEVLSVSILVPVVAHAIITDDLSVLARVLRTVRSAPEGLAHAPIHRRVPVHALAFK